MPDDNRSNKSNTDNRSDDRESRQSSGREGGGDSSTDRERDEQGRFESETTEGHVGLTRRIFVGRFFEEEIARNRDGAETRRCVEAPTGFVPPELRFSLGAGSGTFLDLRAPA